MKSTKVFSFVGLAAGALAIIMALVVFINAAGFNENSDSVYLGRSSSYEYYGGDAYSGIQHAAADTSVNVKAQTEIILAGYRSQCFAFGAMLLCLGLGMIGYFGGKLGCCKVEPVCEVPKPCVEEPFTAHVETAAEDVAEETAEEPAE